MEATKPQEVATDIDIQRIMQLIPHRYPFLMIDRVVDVTPGEAATGIKNVSINEFYFQGHFPQRPVMPGVLIIEAMAQTAAVLVVHTLGPESEGKLVYFMSVDNARFRRPVFPGDTPRRARRAQAQPRQCLEVRRRGAGRRQARGRGDFRRHDHGHLSRLMPDIHPTAVVEPGARLAASAKIGPFCLVGSEVELGEGVELVSHVVVAGRTSVGEGTRIFPFASIGHAAAGHEIQAASRRASSSAAAT